MKVYDAVNMFVEQFILIIPPKLNSWKKTDSAVSCKRVREEIFITHNYCIGMQWMFDASYKPP